MAFVTLQLTHRQNYRVCDFSPVNAKGPDYSDYSLVVIQVRCF